MSYSVDEESENLNSRALKNKYIRTSTNKQEMNRKAGNEYGIFARTFVAG